MATVVTGSHQFWARLESAKKEMTEAGLSHGKTINELLQKLGFRIPPAPYCSFIANSAIVFALVFVFGGLLTIVAVSLTAKSLLLARIAKEIFASPELSIMAALMGIYVGGVNLFRRRKYKLSRWESLE